MLKRRKVHGFTIVEIVVGFIIIGILTAILVPTIARRSDDAKIAAADSDLQHLADAMERVSIDIGPVVRMYALDDVRSGDGRVNTNVALDEIDGLTDEFLTGSTYYLDPRNLFISTTTGTYLPPTAQDTLFALIAGPDTVYNAQVQWRGPYVQWMRDVNGNDWPDDPWGHDYIFFSDIGALFPPDPLSPDTNLQQDHSNQFQTTSPSTPVRSSLDRVFDRFTIVSLGPNGLPGDGGTGGLNSSSEYGKGDDRIRQFGGN